MISNREAEIGLIGSLLLDGSMAKTLELGGDDFYEEDCREVYLAILKVAKRGAVDIITVANEIGRSAFLSECISQTPTSLHGQYYADIVKDYSLHRQLITLGSELDTLGNGDESISEAIGKAQKKLSDLMKKATSDEIITPGKLTELAEERYNKLTRTQPGLSTGIPKLDDICGGLFRGELIILAGRPGLGKTTFGLQMAKDIAVKKNVLLCSLEMSVSSLTDKLMVGITGKPASVIRRGNYSDDTLDKLILGLGSLSEGNLYISHGARNTTQLRGYIEKMMSGYGCSAVFVDHLQMFMDKAKSRYEAITNISSELQTMTKEFDIPIVVLSQLSRAVEIRADKRPVLSDLRDSGSIEQDADAVWFLYRDSYYSDTASREAAEIIVAKNRATGVTGKIQLKWDGLKERYYQA